MVRTASAAAALRQAVVTAEGQVRWQGDWIREELGATDRLSRAVMLMAAGAVVLITSLAASFVMDAVAQAALGAALLCNLLAIAWLQGTLGAAGAAVVGRFGPDVGELHVAAAHEELEQEALDLSLLEAWARASEANSITLQRLSSSRRQGFALLVLAMTVFLGGTVYVLWT